MANESVSDSEQTRSDDSRLGNILEEMLECDETITYRAVARYVGLAPSSITRSSKRRRIIEEFIERQKRYRRWAGRAGKQGQRKLVRQLAERDERIEALEQQVDILVASHKALILAVGELGGMEAWRRFFPEYEEASRVLRSIDAV